MRHLDLFSGIGGFALAARWMGWETIGFCEIEDYPQRVLRKNFPGVPIHDDIRTLTGATIAEWGGCGLITGGFPCQPFSTAGQRRGTEDNRHLWPEMFRVIDECRPRYVLGENVANFANMALDGVCADLESIGYSVGTVIVPAVSVQAPHQRHRTWIMAHADSIPASERRECQDIPGEGIEGRHVRSGGNVNSREESIQLAREDSPAVSHADCERELQSQGEFGNQRERSGDGCGWMPEPSVGRVAYGVPGGVDRLAGLGNAIVPQVAYEIFRAMPLS